MSCIPIVCPTCGLPLGDRGELFDVLRNEKIEKIVKSEGILADLVPLKDGLQIDCIDILNILKIDKDCCRMYTISAIKSD
jgi:DNA-directed RNA polymerase subunit N (RpoN/RPB10)